MGASGEILVGSTAPGFSAPLATPDGEVREVSLSSLCEDGAVLLVFQPTDFELDGFAERRALGDTTGSPPTTGSGWSGSTARGLSPTGSSQTTST